MSDNVDDEDADVDAADAMTGREAATRTNESNRRFGILTLLAVIY